MDESISQQVVLTYQAPQPQEVVLVYHQNIKPEPPLAIPEKKAHSKGFLIFLAGVLLIFLAIGTAWLYLHFSQSQSPVFYEETSQDITIPIYETEDDGAVMELLMTNDGVLTPQEIYALVNPSVVTILCESNGVEMSMGTGVIYSSDGYVVTNYHVVEGAASCAIALSTGTVYQAYYVAGDEDNDLAVLKVNATDLPAATFGESDLLSVGDTVYAIGNPLGLELRGTFTDGIVSAINRDVEINGRTMSTLIQTNAALNSGNSGGPLINSYGQVVGINTMKMGGETTSVEGIGFAIPSSTVQRIVQDLVTVGEVQPEPTLGITVGTVTTALPDGTNGTLVYEVTPESPADNAGIQAGDIIIALNGQVVETSSDVLRVRRQLRIGDTVHVSLWRDERILSVTMILVME